MRMRDAVASEERGHDQKQEGESRSSVRWSSKWS
jgi:hypothetical protein